MKDGKPFYAMRALNHKITDKVLTALIEELILLRNNDNPIAILSSTPILSQSPLTGQFNFYSTVKEV